MKTPDELPDRVRDPVCGMRFRPGKAASSIEYRGRPVYFCTDACHRQFEEEPERYVANTRTHRE